MVLKRAGKLKGEHASPEHKDEIVVRSWGWGMRAGSAVGSGVNTVRRSHRELVVVKSIDTASTGLMNALAGNDEVAEAVLTMRKAGGESIAYFTLKLNKARVVGFDLDVDEQGVPVEKIAFAFQKIAVEYTPQSSGGSGGAAHSFEDDWMEAA